MSATLQQDFQAVENWVITFFGNLKHDVQVVEEDIIKVFQFIQPYGNQIATGILGGIAIAGALGVGIPAPLLTAAALLSKVSSTVNAAVAAQQMAAAAGKGVGDQTLTLLGTAYQDLKTTQTHLATGQALLAVAKPVTAP